MKKLIYLLAVSAAACLAAVPATSQKRSGKVEIIAPKDYRAIQLRPSQELQTMLGNSINEVLASYNGKFKPEEIAATIVDLRDPNDLKTASVRGEEKIYPASVVKMFYMAALERQLADGKVTSSKELERGLRDMIVDSANEATQYVLDVLTDTASGAELPTKEFEVWQYKRNRVNRFYSSMGYQNINTNQKTFCEDAYGIEQQSRNFPTNAANRNKLTTDATARLLSEVVLGKMNTPERTKQMMDLMKRDPFITTTDLDKQDNGFTGKLFLDRKLKDVKLWSKAGWTSTARHDAAYVETADGLKFVIVIFTENHANDREPIPTVVGKLMNLMRKN
jgi:beta-lactamase class A